MKLNYTVGREAAPINPDSPLWTAALPMGPADTVHPPRHTAGPTYGQYFTAAGHFLAQNQSANLIQAASQVLNRPVDAEQITDITVQLVKHGALYHPALITVLIDDSTRASLHTLRFVLNVAVGLAGRRALAEEFTALQRLNRLYPQGLIPRVYVCSGNGGQPIMFLGQWFENFHEFHIAAGQTGRAPQWLVWDDRTEAWALSRAQVSEAYRQFAYILAYYYNPISFEAILDWHHASGDFVLQTEGRKIRARLITVRRYAPFMEWEGSLPKMLESWLLFFLRTCLWLRLDRLDGVGDLAWADQFVLNSIAQGFNQGITAMAHLKGLPIELISGFKQYLAAHDDRLLLAFYRAMVDRIPASDKKKFINQRLNEHVAALLGSVRLPR